MINSIIDEEKLKYAIPIYNHDHIIKTDEELTFTIDDDAFLECVYLRIRGESIKFSSKLKKQNENLENKLIKDIRSLEEQDNFEEINQKINDKKQELEKSREDKIRGEIVRARIQWINEGERLSKYFCKLENINFVEKNNKKSRI